MQTLKSIIDFLRANEPPLSVLAALIVIAGLVFAIWKWGGMVLRKTWRFLTRYHPTIPRETIRFVPLMREQWWHMGSQNGQPSMQIVCVGHVTNIIDRSVYILNARIIRPRKATTGGLVTTRHPHMHSFGLHPIFAGDTSEVHFSFWVKPPVRRENKSLTATILLVDQFGNEHKVKNLLFKYR